ncbi:hypothetical protein B0H10DRAFT_2439512 [Mycena sp. CBHHK59/15]|nr:hypothetical protein B0H10DRAFT_2439512 [Mycena sp. CBHHK59/15]
MPYVHLGTSGLAAHPRHDIVRDARVTALGAHALEHIRLAWEAGINSLDTANIYSIGRSEVILGKAIRHSAGNDQGHTPASVSGRPPRRDGVVNQWGLSTRCGCAGEPMSFRRSQIPGSPVAVVKDEREPFQQLPPSP